MSALTFGSLLTIFWTQFIVLIVCDKFVGCRQSALLKPFRWPKTGRWAGQCGRLFASSC
jgi:hypothetical protein